MTIVAFLLLLAQSTPAQPQPAPQPEVQGREIVVRGIALAESEKALAECLARKCPPKDDIAAAMRHAENQFLNGDYQKARATLKAARGRNDRYSRRYPVEVAELLRADSLVGRHLGLDDASQRTTIVARNILAEGRARDDAMTLAVSLEIGDSYARLGKFDFAENSYEQVLHRAEAAKVDRLAAVARVRLIALYVALSRGSPLRASYLRKARGVLDVMLARHTDPALDNFTFAARLMVARATGKPGEPNPLLDDLVANSRRQGSGMQRPILLDSKPIALDERSGTADPNTVTGDIGYTNPLDRAPSASFDRQWFDVAFWIRPNGSVEEIEVIRKSPRLSGSWSEKVLESLRSRRYAPLALSNDDFGMLRVERYTYTASYEQGTVSRLRVRKPTGRIEFLDLTGEPRRADPPATP